MIGGVQKEGLGPGGAPAHGVGGTSPGGPTITGANAVVCATAGFLLGAAFWITLGVLSLMGSAEPQPVAAPDPHNTDAASCTALNLDRRLGRTTAGPCRVLPAPLREVVASVPGDRSGH
jgi:hypothetical protein